MGKLNETRKQKWGMTPSQLSSLLESEQVMLTESIAKRDHFSARDRNIISKMMKNQKEMIKENSKLFVLTESRQRALKEGKLNEASDFIGSSNYAPYQRVLVPFVVDAFEQRWTYQIVSVQPTEYSKMTVTFLDYIYAGNSNDIVGGGHNNAIDAANAIIITFNKATDSGTLDLTNTSFTITSEVGAAGSGVNTAIAGDILIPVAHYKNNAICKYVGGETVATTIDLMNDTGNTTSINQAGRVYTTLFAQPNDGNISRKLIPTLTGPMTLSEVENVTEFNKLSVIKKDVNFEVQYAGIQADISIFTQQLMASEHQYDLITNISTFMLTQLGLDQDALVLDKILTIAKGQGDFSIDLANVSMAHFRGEDSKLDYLLGVLMDLASDIEEAVYGKEAVDKIVVGKTLFSYLSKKKDIFTKAKKRVGGDGFKGVLNDTFDVYRSKRLEPTRFILVYKGTGEWDSGIVVAPHRVFDIPVENVGTRNKYYFVESYGIVENPKGAGKYYRTGLVYGIPLIGKNRKALI